MLQSRKKTILLQGLACCLSIALLTACGSSGAKKVDNEGLSQLGDQLHARGDDTGAADFYSRAIQHDPKDLASRKSLATLLEAHGDNADAAKQYAEAIKLLPDDGELHRDYGRVLLKLNQPSDARGQYQLALDSDSDDIKAMNGMGVSFDYLKDHAAAQAIYRHVLEDNPNDIVTLANLGHSYVLSGAWEEAIHLLEPHLKDKAATPAFRQNLAEAYGMNGMDADAKRVMQMDLPPDQIKKNLAYYHAERKKLANSTLLAADLGNFPTREVAEGQAETIRDKFSENLRGLTVSVMPEVQEIGGTPAFGIYVKGFDRPTQLRTFCNSLKKEGFLCRPQTGS